MSEKLDIREQLAECALIIEQLVDVVGTAKKAFIHQRGQLLVQLNNQQDPLCRKITSFMSNMTEMATGKSEGEREACIRFHSIFTHLQIIAETTCRLEEILQKQIKEGVLFSDKAISQVSYLFDKQTDILSNLADIMRNGSMDSHRHTLDDCNKLSKLCLQFATEHETRLVEGLCFPQAAPLFLAILDQTQTIAHHEQDIAHLLGNNFKLAEGGLLWLTF